MVIPSTGTMKAAPEPPVGFISRVSNNIRPPFITFKSPLIVVIGAAVPELDCPISTFISEILNLAL